MTILQRITNAKAGLSVTRKHLAAHRNKAREAHRELQRFMMESLKDPANAHFHFSAIGRCYMEQERELGRAALAKGSVFSLRQEINMLKAQLPSA